MDSILRTSKVWVVHIDDISISSNKNGYLLYHYCPYHYCHSPEEVIHINFSNPNYQLTVSVLPNALDRCVASQALVCLLEIQNWPALFVVT